MSQNFCSPAYLKLIKNLGKNHPIERNFDPEMLEEIIEVLFKEMHFIDRENSQSSFEYLRLINELIKFYPIERIRHSKMMHELVRRTGKDLRYIPSENPQLALEYIRLIISLEMDNVSELLTSFPKLKDMYITPL